MAIRKKKTEIKRLISAFEAEANKFHDLRLSTVYREKNKIVNERRFERNNHIIMLWQYYGIMSDAHQVTMDVLDRHPIWGVLGAELSAYSLLEGETCQLFMRMANRAGALFSEKERDKIKSRQLEELVEKKMKSSEGKPVCAHNTANASIWLNYLLYYISKVRPFSSDLTRIDLDPFTLSLMALEDLLENEIIQKVDKSMTRLEDINFKVAVSFPGEKRAYVADVVNELKSAYGKDSVFYDFDYQSQLARPNLDTYIQNIYRNQADLLVVFLCEDYTQKQWCGLEWRAVRDIIKHKEDQRIMFVKFDDASIDGVFSIDGYIDASYHDEKKVAQFIHERIELMAENA
ncbi:TIR domain-containing protein [Shewanella sp. MBTL60-007]|uniref:TIR domain-containing protein n=1 Tax=Shewanella sp. MBTL60-007 TaxID=2815911 RepID=UPI001BBAE7E1|nr:TIR domain-containing protein [Shewanella sp. MBTL60-007]GIU26472.1 disease resistance protein [Shewanella sp. MBTL60-007]